MKFRIAAVIAASAACALACAAPAAAASAVVTVTSTTLAFNAVNMSNTALTSAPLTASAQVTFTTTPGGAGGTVTVTPVNLSGGGDTLNARDFTLTCKRTGANNGFVASPATQLNGATACGTLTQGKNNVTSTFTIELTLNTSTTATVPFGAATFTGIFTVTATAS